MTTYYPDDPDGPMHSLWWYMFVNRWKVWATVGTIWTLFGIGVLLDPPSLYWFVISVVAWTFVVWSCFGIVHDWRVHKEQMRRIHYRHEARMIQMDRRHAKVMEQIRNAPWN